MAISTRHKRPRIADNLRVIMTDFVRGANGDADYEVFEVPRNGLVTVKAVEITTAFTGSSTGTLTVGFKENGSAIDADGFAADATTLSEATGIKSINVVKHFPKGGMVTLGVTKGDSSADIVARLFLDCTVVVP